MSLKSSKFEMKKICQKEFKIFKRFVSFVHENSMAYLIREELPKIKKLHLNFRFLYVGRSQSNFFLYI